MKLNFVLTVVLFFTLGISQLNPYTAQKVENYKDEEPEKIEKALPDFMRSSPQWALETLEAMTLEEKIAQSFMVNVTPNLGEKHLKVVDSLVSVEKVGGIITFQGTTESVKSAIERYQNQSAVPLLVGTDGEWGSAMRIKERHHFPYQLTMGAANDVESTKIIGEAMGKDMAEMGIHINFAPDVDINTNPDNPIIGFRAFGEDPVTVAKHGRAIIQGMQEYNILSSMKHFPGHGDTKVDSHRDLPVVNISKTDFKRKIWLPYKQGRLVGASSIMVSHLKVPSLDSTGLPASLSPTILKHYIREYLKFDGLIITDALNMKGVTNYYGAIDIVKRAYIAGNDVLVFPTKVRESIKAIKYAVEAGEISEQEVDEKTLRVLRAKQYAIIENDLQNKELNQEKVDFAEATIYEKALTVIKNDSVIPIKNTSGKNLIVNIGGDGSSFVDAVENYMQAEVKEYKTANEAWTDLQNKLTNYDHIFVNLIAKHPWPFTDFGYPKGWREFVEKLPKTPNVYVSVFGNPYNIRQKTVFENVDAVILAFQNSKLGQDRAAQLLFGGFQGNTKLSITLSADYPRDLGFVTPPASRLKFTSPLELGISDTAFYTIDSIALDGIKKGAYPSCQVVVAKDGKVIYRKSFGTLTYDKKQPVNNKTLYDLASITKIVSSTASLMYLQDQNQFDLEKNLGDYLEDLTEGTVYHNLKMKDILTHQARLTPWIPFYKSTLNGGKPKPELYASTKEGNKTAMVTENLFLDSQYEDSMYRIIISKPLLPSKRYKYSDIGFYFTKRIIEKQTHQELEDFTQHNFYTPMGLPTMGYNPLTRFQQNQIAPSEKDTYFRYQTIQGTVHDMGAAMTDGVGGHAGLFSNATDLAGFMQLFLNKGVYGGKRYLSEEVINTYTACQFCPNNRRGAGFDKPVVSGSGGPTGKYVSKSSYGHTGFTGTIAWADPVANINYVFLSNRTYPDAENWKITQMDIRTKIQDEIYKILENNEG